MPRLRCYQRPPQDLPSLPFCRVQSQKSLKRRFKQAHRHRPLHGSLHAIPWASVRVSGFFTQSMNSRTHIRRARAKSEALETFGARVWRAAIHGATLATLAWRPTYKTRPADERMEAGDPLDEGHGMRLVDVQVFSHFFHVFLTWI